MLIKKPGNSTRLLARVSEQPKLGKLKQCCQLFMLFLFCVYEYRILAIFFNITKRAFLQVYYIGL